MVLVEEVRNWRQAASDRVGAMMDIVIGFAAMVVGSVLSYKFQLFQCRRL